MPQSLRHPVAFAAVVTVLLAATAIGLIWATRDDSPSPSSPRTTPVTLTLDGVPVGQFPHDEALHEASGIVGFEVTLPAALPRGDLVLVAVDASVGPEGIANPLRAVRSWYAVGDDVDASPLVLVVEELSGPALSPPETVTEAFDIDGATVHYYQQPGGSGYYAVVDSEGRDFLVIASGPEQPPPAEMLPMLASLVSGQS